MGDVVHSGVSGARNVDTLFHAQVGLVRLPKKVHWDTLD
jgi:hypothetical protein